MAVEEPKGRSVRVNSMYLLQQLLEPRLVAPNIARRAPGDGGLARLPEIRRCNGIGVRLILAVGRREKDIGDTRPARGMREQGSVGPFNSRYSSFCEPCVLGLGLLVDRNI
jgi:hypothetical protein